MKKYDITIIGSGLAALSIALKAPTHYKIAILSKSDLNNNASSKAQGGIAGVFDKTVDSFQQHIDDTLIAGDGLCNETAVEYIVTHGTKTIDWLVAQQVGFTKVDQQLHLTKEGGHSQRRIAHVADSTGEAIWTKLRNNLRAFTNIDIYEHYFATELLLDDTKTRCVGVLAQDLINNNLIQFSSERTVLASGGIGQLYPQTTNPSTATGDGVAMAYRAGCIISNLEFIQFHPTSLKISGKPTFLITEAMRGEGAILKLPNGNTFMHNYDARGDLAPRDIVAKAIYTEMLKNKIANVYLDIKYKGKDFILEHFPMIYQTCLDYGLDISQELIPIAPAAHYSCGGVKTDIHGRTTIKNLYAVGEVAATGLHGANRLASNSLLECVVIGDAIVQDIMQQQSVDHTKPIENINIINDIPTQSTNIQQPAQANIETYRTELQNLVWQYLGIIRTNQGLQTMLTKLSALKQEIIAIKPNTTDTLAYLELNNMLTVAWVLTNSAILRHESRGTHTNADYPNKANIIQETNIQI